MSGVSKATVSRVLSGNYAYLRPETRHRVEAAIEALAYRPSSVARSLTSKRTQTAGVMIADIGNPFYADVLRGIEDAVEHLIGLGHRRFANISGPSHLPTSSYRREAFQQALAAYDVAAEHVAVIEGNLRIDGGRRALAPLLALPQPPVPSLPPTI